MTRCDPAIEVERILREDSAILVSQKKHEKWKLSNGKLFVRSKTPSDRRAALNALSNLKVLLELNEPDRGAEGERSDKSAEIITRILRRERDEALAQVKRLEHQYASIKGNYEAMRTTADDFQLAVWLAEEKIKRLGRQMHREQTAAAKQRRQTVRLKAAIRAGWRNRIRAMWFRFKEVSKKNFAKLGCTK